MGIIIIGLTIATLLMLVLQFTREALWHYHYNRYKKLQALYNEKKGLSILFQEDIRQEMAKEFEKINR